MTDTHSTFRLIDAMEVRRKFGEIGNRVRHERRRFVVQVRGKDAFLIVPLSDKQAIASHADQETQACAYKAFERLEGMVKEPIRDASDTVDQWVYDATQSKGDDAG